jgi:hypothetical protein
MRLQVKRGRNQKGICYLSSSHSGFDRAVCKVKTENSECLVDIRANERVPVNTLILDLRIFDILGLREDDEVVLDVVDFAPAALSEITLRLRSERGLDNSKVAEAISKRVNDLQDDFDGLIVGAGELIPISRLELVFEVAEVLPQSPSRIVWNKLGRIRLLPAAVRRSKNLVCVTEVGGATQVVDALAPDGSKIPRCSLILDALGAMEGSLVSGSEQAYFSGVAFSDEVQIFETYDSETGAPTDIAGLESKSVIKAYREWVEDTLEEHRRSPSDLGDAVSDSIELAERIRNMNDLPTAIVVFSSGIFSAGPNPVKSIRRAQGLKETGIFLLQVGTTGETAILEAMAGVVGGFHLQVASSSDIRGVIDRISTWAGEEVLI